MAHMKRLILLNVLFGILLFGGSDFSFGMGLKRGNDSSDPEAVSSVDLNQYQGRWYDIAHSPNFFQKPCLHSTAEYKIIDANSISVFNTCYKKSGRVSTISGKASVVNPASPAKLRVVFSVFGKPKGDYWITELDPNYQWAVVSGPGKKDTFLLSRVAPLPDALKTEIITQLKKKGYPTDQFIYDQY